jgi:hypothetical protein
MTVDEERRRIMGTLVVTEFVTLDGVMEDPSEAETFDRGGGATSSPRGSWRRSPMERPD